VFLSCPVAICHFLFRSGCRCAAASIFSFSWLHAHSYSCIRTKACFPFACSYSSKKENFHLRQFSHVSAHAQIVAVFDLCYYRFSSYRGQVVAATLRHAHVLCACAIVTAIPYTSPSQKWFSDLLYNLCRLSDEGGPVGQSVRKFVGSMSPFLGIDVCLLAGAFNNQSLQEGAQRHLGRLAFTFRC